MLAFLAPTRSAPMPRNIQMGCNSRDKKTRHSDPFAKLEQSGDLLFPAAVVNFSYTQRVELVLSQPFWPSSHLLKGHYTYENEHDNAIYKTNTVQNPSVKTVLAAKDSLKIRTATCSVGGKRKSG